MFDFICFIICIGIIRKISASNLKQKPGTLLPLIFSGLLFSAFIGMSPLFVIFLVGMLIRHSKQQNSENTPDSQNQAQSAGNRPRKTASRRKVAPASETVSEPSAPFPALPTSAKKRRKIIARFNEAYSLNLTEAEINRIAEASYMSAGWAEEIHDMTEDYETVSSWYANGTPWLKAYLSAFQKQSISSDFQVQEQIVLDSFDRVFSDVCCFPNQTVESAIEQINRKYLTRFNEATFTIAYRFLESKGKKYPISFAQVYSVNEEIDELLDKYSDRKPMQPMR